MWWPTNLNVMVDIISQNMQGKLLVLRSRSQWTFRILAVSPETIFWTAQPFLTKYGILVYHCGMECHTHTKWVAIFKVNVTVRAQITRYDCFYIFWTNDSLLQSNLSLMVDQLKPKCVVKILDCSVQGQGHNEQLKIVIICPDIFWTTQPLVTKLRMMICNNKLQCHAKNKNKFYFQCQGHSEDLCSQMMTVFTISSELMILLQLANWLANSR